MKSIGNRFLVGTSVTCVGIFLVGVAAGNGPWHIDNCANIPPGAMPAPSGTYVRKWQGAQTARAAMDDFVIYKHEWHMGGKALGPYGRYHLDEIAKRLDGVPFLVVIQPETDDALNSDRRKVIVEMLIKAGFTDAEARVIIAFPRAEGLYGEEAERIFIRTYGSRGGITGGIGGSGSSGGLGGISGGFGAMGGIGGGGGLGLGVRGY